MPPFELSTICERIRAGLARAKAEGMRLWHRDGLAPYELEWFVCAAIENEDHTAVGWRHPSARTRPLAPPNARAATAATLPDKIFIAELLSPDGALAHPRGVDGRCHRWERPLPSGDGATGERAITIQHEDIEPRAGGGREALSHPGLICCSMCFATAEDCFSSAVVPPTLKAATARSDSLSCRAAP